MSAWPRLRAVLVTGHLLAITLLAAPAPVGGMNEATFATRDMQETFRALSGGLGAVGIERSPAQVEEALWVLGSGFMDTREAVLTPLRPYAKAVGAKQGWRMFWTVPQRQARLVIEIDEGRGYAELYRPLSEEADWRADIFAQERLRAVVNSWTHGRHRRTYGQMVDHLAAEIAAERPDALRIRVAMEQNPTPSPEALRAGQLPEPHRRWVEVRELEELR